MNLLSDYVSNIKLYYGIKLDIVKVYYNLELYVVFDDIPELRIPGYTEKLSKDPFVSLWFDEYKINKVLLTLEAHNAIIRQMGLIKQRYHRFCMAHYVSIPEMLNAHPRSASIYFSLLANKLTIHYSVKTQNLDYEIIIPENLVEETTDWWNAFHRYNSTQTIKFFHCIYLQKRIAETLQDILFLLK